MEEDGAGWKQDVSMKEAGWKVYGLRAERTSNRDETSHLLLFISIKELR